MEFRLAGGIRVMKTESTMLKEAAGIEERTQECHPDNWAAISAPQLHAKKKKGPKIPKSHFAKANLLCM